MHRARGALVGQSLALMLLLTMSASQLTHAHAGADCVADGDSAQRAACALRDFQTVDTQINVLYSDVMRALSAHERPQLRREHTAWLQRRLSHCKQSTRAFESRGDGAERFHECMRNQTAERRQGLLRWLSMDTPAQP